MKVKSNIIKTFAVIAGLFLALSLVFARPVGTAKAAVEVDAVSVSMAGAGVRMSGERARAIRFRASIPTTEYEELKSGYEVEIGMLIIPKEILSGELTLENAEARRILRIVSEDALTYVEGDKTYYNAVVSNIPAEYYTQDIYGRAYVTLTKDADSKTFYSDVQTRTLAYIAHKELTNNGELTPEQTATLTEYKAGKTFYNVAAENGIVLDYDCAYEGKKLDVKFSMPANKYLKSVEVNGDASVFSWTDYTVTALGEDMTVAGVLRDQTDTPSVLGSGDSAKYYVDPVAWGSIANVAEVGDCASATISDEDWNALVAAGYKGNIVKGKVASYVHPTRAHTGNAANVTTGIALGGLTMEDLYEKSAYDDVKNNYYVSVWLKASAAYNVPVHIVFYDTVNKKQATGGDPLWPNFPANKWTELRIPVSSMRTAWYFMLNNGGEFANSMIGLYSYHSNLSADTTVNVYSAELMLNEIETNDQAASIDLTPSITNPYAYLTRVDGFAIYGESGELTEGVDYSANGYTVSGLDAGDYKVVYNLASVTTHQGAFNSYPNGATVTRSLKVAKIYTTATVIGDMSDAANVKAYINPTGSERDVSVMTQAVSTAGTITDDEYNALIAAGYVGGKSDRNVVNVAFPEESTSRKDVYFQFDETLSDDLFKEALAANPSDVYVSVWLKSDKLFLYNTYANIVGQTTHYAAIQDIAPEIGGNANDWLDAGGAGKWVEVKIPFAKLRDTGWYVNNGYLDAGENYAYGFAFISAAHNNYISGATFTIYSIELAIVDKTATAGAAQNVGINATVYGTYTIAVLDDTGNDVTATCTVSGSNVTVPAAGSYTLVYTLTDGKFAGGTTIKAKLTVTE